jgi:large subunit ribosomal protein L22
MPSWRYSVTDLDSDKTAIASGRDLRIKPKAAREICNYLKGMKLANAKTVLLEVMELKKPIPYYRYKLKVPHRKEAQGFDAGRYPQKAAGKRTLSLRG